MCSVLVLMYPMPECPSHVAERLFEDALTDEVVMCRAFQCTKDGPPHVLRVHPEIAAAIVEAEHANVAVAYPGTCGSRVGRPRRERGVCVTHTSHEVDCIEHHFGEQAQRRKVGAGRVVVIDMESQTAHHQACISRCCCASVVRRRQSIV